MFAKIQKTISVHAEQSNSTFFIDYLITDEPSAISPSIDVVTYGITVKKRLSTDNTETDCVSAPSLFTSIGEAEAFVDMLSRNTVTPLSFLYIVEDYLAPA